MGRCCVPECKTKSTVGLHVFPANQKIAKKWVRFTRTFHLNFKKITEYRVCGTHFKPSDRMKNISGNNCLKTNAVPCLLLPADLSFETEHNYDWDYKFQKGEAPTPKPKQKRKYLSKKKFVAMSNAILTNDPILNNIGNEVVIGDEPKAEPVILDPHVMLREALNRIQTLEEKLLKKSKEKTSLAAKLRINGKKLKKVKQILEGGFLNGGKIMKYLQEQNYSKPLIEFLFMQIENKNRKAKGYRYSNEQKSLALAIYKQGPKCYRFLQRIFILPCKRTLGRHSAHLILETGIDPKFFEYLKDKVTTMPEIDKACTIAWDEMSLKANLNYNQRKDQIDGLVELDGVKRPAFATHSLTFMVRGINAPYKQPVTFFYTNGLKSCELAALVILVTEAVLETGLNVIGSCCDQVGTNVSAVNYLIYKDFVRRKPDGRLLAYQICNRTLIHCYDPPHLIKVLRNNLQTKNLRHFVTKRWDISHSNEIVGKKAKLASWTHVRDLYHFDSQGNQRRLRKITDEHISPNKEKMKVSVATQIFSETYGKVMIDCCEKKQLPDNFNDTAQILLFFNDLYDSINGSNRPQNNTLKGSVNKDSPHFVFWDYALQMLSKMNFINIETGNISNTSSVLKKFESTIRGYIKLTRICFDLNIVDVSIRYNYSSEYFYFELIATKWDQSLDS